MWPNFDSVGKRCQAVLDDYKSGKDIEKYRTKGTEDKRVIEPRRTRMEDSTSNSMTHNQTNFSHT